MGVTRFRRHSAAIIKTTRWRALRQAALRRDGFACVICSARGRLEIDHVKPVRDAPELAYDLGNLQCLCPGCHTLKTRVDLGLPDISDARKAWRSLLRSGSTPINDKENQCSHL